jgi:hypothetical protein
VKQKQFVNIIENHWHQQGSQLLGFLPPGGAVLVLSPGRKGHDMVPPVMAIPIAELFVKHERRHRQTDKQSDSKGT